jgi:hypothetical protein
LLYFAGRWITQSEPAALDDVPPLDPLPTTTEEPEPPGDTVVLPLTPFGPVVIVVELEPAPLSVTTRQGLPLTTVVPFGPEVTATLSAKAGIAITKKPIRTAPVYIRIGILRTVDPCPSRCSPQNWRVVIS